MSMQVLFSIILVVLLSAGSVRAGCVPLDATLLPAPCNSTFRNYHYAHFDTEQQLTERIAALSQAILSVNAIPDPACAQAAFFATCTGVTLGIPLCLEYEDDQGNFEPVDELWTTCIETCYEFNDACGAIFTAIGFEQFLPDCGIHPNVSELPVVTNSGDVLTLGCLNGSERVLVTPECPVGMILNPEEAVCEFGCPSPVLSASQINTANLLQQIVGWFSLVTAIVFISLAAIIPTSRLFPQRLVLWLAVASIPLSLAFVLASFVGGVTDVWCDSDSSLSFASGSSTSSPVCTFQGWLIQFGSLAVASWWMCVGVNLALLLTVGRNRITGKIELVYHAISWVIPAGLSIGVAAAGKIRYEDGNTYCFISSESDNAIQIATWFVWLGVYLLVGTIALFVCIGKIIHVRVSVAGKKGASNWTTYIRIVLFLVIFLYFYAVIFAQRILDESNRDELDQTENLYKLCLIAPIAGQDDCEEILDQAPINWGLQMVSDFNLVSQGFFVSVLFFSISMFVWWFRRLSTCSGWQEPLHPPKSSATHSTAVGLRSTFTHTRSTLASTTDDSDV